MNPESNDGRALPARRKPVPGSRSSSGTAFPDLEAFAGQFFDQFSRAGHRRQFLQYLVGLVASPVKTIEGIATFLSGSAGPRGGLAQSLQHFISSSPWDERRLLSAWLARLFRDGHLGGTPAVVTVTEIDIPKKGSHSVGVQRQLAKSLNKKLNCQVAILLGLATPSFHLPVAMRLYLPGRWLSDSAQAVERTVPQEHRRFLTKEEIAFELVREWLPETVPVAGVAVQPTLAGAGGILETFLIANGLSLAVPEAGRLAGSADGFSVVSAVAALALGCESVEALKDEYGLCQFEGRSWRGWHHHAALVCVSHGFGKLAASGSKAGKPKAGRRFSGPGHDFQPEFPGQ